MSMFGATMVMRAEVLRNAAGTDVYGHKKPPHGQRQVVQDAVPCFVQVTAVKDLVDGKEMTVETITGYFRHDANLARGDMLPQVKDRRDRVVVEGPLIVDSEPVVRTYGAVPSHKEVSLRRARG